MDVNAASYYDWLSLPGVGRKDADKLIRRQLNQANYLSRDDVMQVVGVLQVKQWEEEGLVDFGTPPGRASRTSRGRRSSPELPGRKYGDLLVAAGLEPAGHRRYRDLSATSTSNKSSVSKSASRLWLETEGVVLKQEMRQMQESFKESLNKELESIRELAKQMGGSTNGKAEPRAREGLSEEKPPATSPSMIGAVGGTAPRGQDAIGGHLELPPPLNTSPRSAPSTSNPRFRLRQLEVNHPMEPAMGATNTVASGDKYPVATTKTTDPPALIRQGRSATKEPLEPVTAARFKTTDRKLPKSKTHFPVQTCRPKRKEKRRPQQEMPSSPSVATPPPAAAAALDFSEPSAACPLTVTPSVENPLSVLDPVPARVSGKEQDAPPIAPLHSQGRARSREGSRLPSNQSRARDQKVCRKHLRPRGPRKQAHPRAHVTKKSDPDPNPGLPECPGMAYVDCAGQQRSSTDALQEQPSSGERSPERDEIVPPPSDVPPAPVLAPSLSVSLAGESLPARPRSQLPPFETVTVIAQWRI